jgi:protein gp37
MGKETNIAYVHHSWNPWLGCNKISPGCANCYAYTMLERFHRKCFGANPRIRTKSWGTPLTFNRRALYMACGKCFHNGITQGGCRPRIFLSLCDWLDDSVPLDWLRELLTTIVTCKNLDWLLLTKRPENFFPRLGEILATEGSTNHVTAQCVARNWLKGNYPENVWVGASAENEKYLHLRLPHLHSIPAAIRWLSIEPILEPMVLPDFAGQINWVVVGGESGKNFRQVPFTAIQSVALQCQRNNIPVFVKQDCGRKSGMQGNLADTFWAMKQFPNQVNNKH